MSAVRFSESVDGVTFAVRVTPRAKRNALAGVRGESLKVQVTAPPEDGRANEAVIELLAETLGVKRRQVGIVSGASSRDKVVRVTGMACAALESALA